MITDVRFGGQRLLQLRVNSYRVSISANERDFGRVNPGRKGVLSLGVACC
jgi:hypothetical protein